MKMMIEGMILALLITIMLHVLDGLGVRDYIMVELEHFVNYVDSLTKCC